MGGLNVLTHEKYLAWCLAQESSINMSYCSQYVEQSRAVYQTKTLVLCASSHSLSSLLGR